jgi:hypothetical protein
MKTISALVFALVIIASCKKNQVTTDCSSATRCFDGYIFWGGDPAADGSGWYAATSRVQDSAFFLETVPTPFNADSTAVHICLSETSKKRICFCTGPGSNYYKIVDIIRR